jgi:hypothetical protein
MSRREEANNLNSQNIGLVRGSGNCHRHYMSVCYVAFSAANRALEQLL